MKLISLNTWNGKLLDPLFGFLRKQRDSTDIFCFQEVFDNDSGIGEVFGYQANLFKLLENVLPEFSNFHYFPDFTLLENDVTLHQGGAIFIKKGIDILSSGQHLIFKAADATYNSEENHTSNIGYVEIEHREKSLFIFSYHGIAFPGDKLDSPERIEQSKRIVEFINSKDGDRVLCGDFNLMPDTESVKMIEDAGMKNLIKEFDIKDTRGEINTQMHPDSLQSFADYTFVSEGVTVKSFEVPDAKVSDHCPMILEIE